MNVHCLGVGSVLPRAPVSLLYVYYILMMMIPKVIQKSLSYIYKCVYLIQFLLLLYILLLHIFNIIYTVFIILYYSIIYSRYIPIIPITVICCTNIRI